MSNIHDELICVLKQSTPPGENAVDMLTDIIPMSKEAAYRRLRGEIRLTLEEAVRISQKFNISIDNLIEVNKCNSFCFQFNSIRPDNPMSDYATLMYEIKKALSIIKQDSQSIIYSAANILTGFAFKYRMIAKFRLFRWIYQMQQDGLSRRMIDVEIPPYVHDIETDYINEYYQINTILILDEKIFINFINDIKYFADIELISEEEVARLKQETLLLLDELESMATLGRYETGKSLQIYISNTYIDAAYEYIESENYKICAVNMYGINYLSCENPAVCDFQKIWVESLMRYSTLISKSGELHRRNYFKSQREYVEII